MEYIKIADHDGLIVLRDHKGNKASFDFLEMAVVDSREYAALLEVETNEVVILEIAEDKDGIEKYRMIESDETFNRVVTVFESLFDEE
ncbi:MAG: DUF1292 domain-containing protein [Clostridia bacterium]|nr:DUF1292 domain-containing protein [Clostridia bacterium]